MENEKFLVKLVNGIGHKQAFFTVWGAILLFFVWLMVSHYRRITRRNFRPGSARQTNGGKAVVAAQTSKDLKVK